MSTLLSRFTSLLGSSLVISAPGYKYARSICLLTWKGHASRIFCPDRPEGNPFPARSFLPFCLPHEYFVREQPRGPLLRFPHDSSPLSAGYFSLLQPGLRILATCHCPCNDHAVSDSPPRDNISLGHPITVGAIGIAKLFSRFINLFIFVIDDTRVHHDREFYSAALLFLPSNSLFLFLSYIRVCMDIYLSLSMIPEI